jgi:hypothetical protein
MRQIPEYLRPPIGTAKVVPSKNSQLEIDLHNKYKGCIKQRLTSKEVAQNTKKI